MKTPLFALALVLAPLARAADVPVSRLYSLGPNFRALLGPNRELLADIEQWDSGPGPSEKAGFDRLGLRLDGVNPLALTTRQEGGPFADQHGGKWRIKRLGVMFRNKDASCDGEVDTGKGYKEHFCYFIAPDEGHGGYRFERERWTEGARIVGAVPRAEAERVLEAVRREAEAYSAQRVAERRLMPHEQIGTDMFRRLTSAISGRLTPAGIDRRLALKPSDYLTPRALGSPDGSWLLAYDLADSVPLERVAAIDGRTLEAAGFVYEPRRSVIYAPGMDVQLDSLGIDPFVLNRAFEEAAKAKREERRAQRAEAVGERLRNALP